MDRSYFERLQDEETRRANWRMLDEALQTRSSGSSLQRLRRNIGRALISVGTRLADETTPTPVETIAGQSCRS